MPDYIDIGLKLLGFVASIGGGCAALAWWLGSRLDKITKQISNLKLHVSQRLTRLETKIGINGASYMPGDESHDD